MIGRYTLPPMAHLWSDASRFGRWLDVELAVSQTLEDAKLIPQGVTAELNKAEIKPERISELERTLHHDLIAFTTSISEQVGPLGRYLHYGLTSSDIVDTALSLQLCDAVDIINDALKSLLALLYERAWQYKKLACIGRTHGMYAEPTSFGLKFLGWFAEFSRHQAMLAWVKSTLNIGKLSGAVGTYSILDPVIERKALSRLGLEPEDVATQVIPRDRHAQLLMALANMGSSIERVAVELRHLQRTEVREVEEAFAEKQKGSSAMPHKRNPISAENLTGCARLLRSYLMPALEDVALWHERDISHSSVERIIFPDATTLAHYMLVRLKNLLDGLRILEDNVKANLEAGQGVYFSGRILNHLVEKGWTREKAYALIQDHAQFALEQKTSLFALLKDDARFRESVSLPELQELFNTDRYLQHTDSIYQRVATSYSGQVQETKHD